MTEFRKSKRSRRVVLTTLTAAGAVAVSGCGSSDWSDADAEGQVYASVSECVAAGETRTECENAYSQARIDDSDSAPRFDSQSLCEQEFGSNQCEQRTTSGNSFWVPLLAGFVIGNAIGDVDIDVDGRRRRRYAPLYRSSGGTWFHGGAGYGPLTRRSGGGYGFSRSGFDRPVGAPRTYSRSDVASRGGFGGRSGGASSWGGSRGS
ncbi:MAG TPA: DUF1190 domain-containing protein [Allosphingosinicella sp.]